MVAVRTAPSPSRARRRSRSDMVWQRSGQNYRRVRHFVEKVEFAARCNGATAAASIATVWWSWRGGRRPFCSTSIRGRSFTFAPRSVSVTVLGDCRARLGDPRLRAMMSMRADFFGDLMKDEALYAVHRLIKVPPLREAQLREVVSRPAQLLSARFETEGLADIITRRTAEDAVKDVGAQPGPKCVDAGAATARGRSSLMSPTN